jgi:hypothetical protein
METESNVRANAPTHKVAAAEADTHAGTLFFGGIGP